MTVDKAAPLLHVTRIDVVHERIPPLLAPFVSCWRTSISKRDLFYQGLLAGHIVSVSIYFSIFFCIGLADDYRKAFCQWK
jgi:hypothetical protein